MKYFYPIILWALLFSSILSCGGSGGSSPDLGLSAQNCGNALINESESCDDGNINNSDGCNAHCAWEVGEAICGNGVLENDECCDDGNNVLGDGCSPDCVLESSNHPPSAPVLAAEPASGVIWAPTRLYLSWNVSTDVDVGDSIVYDVYFNAGNVAPGVPYKKEITESHFIIQASSDNRAQYFPSVVNPIYLSPPIQNVFDGQYTWKICARDQHGAQSCSETRIFRTDNSIMGWWRFDEDPSGLGCPSILGGPAGDPGETVCDYSGKGNHGSPQGSTVWYSSLQNNNLLRGVLELENDYVLVPHSPSLNSSSQLTVEVMQSLKAFGDTTDRPLLSKLSSPEATDNSGYAFSFGRGTDLYFWIGNRVLGSSFVGSLNQWVHFVGTYDGTQSSLFENTSLLVSQPTSEPILNNTAPLWIGRSARFNSYYKGQISELILYSKSLTQEELNNSFWAH